MRSKLNLLVATGAAVIFAAHTASAQNGGGLVSNTTSAATTSTVTVTIPGVVGIDIESDVVIDLTSYVTAGGVHANGTACPANTFPPPAGCTGAASYAATATPRRRAPRRRRRPRATSGWLFSARRPRER